MKKIFCLLLVTTSLAFAEWPVEFDVTQSNSNPPFNPHPKGNVEYKIEPEKPAKLFAEQQDTKDTNTKTQEAKKETLKKPIAPKATSQTTFRVPQPREITLAYLKKQPKGNTRDFYIWWFLGQDITPKEADEAYQLASRRSVAIFGRYFKKGSNQTLSRKTICERMDLEELLEQERSCIAAALKLSDAATLPKARLKSIAQNIEANNKRLAKELRILASSDPFLALQKEDADFFGTFFQKVGSKWRIPNLNKPFNPKELSRLLSQNSESFQRMLRLMIIARTYQNVKQSLAASPYQKGLDYEMSFYMGFNARDFGKNDLAISYFKQSISVAPSEMAKNRANFWIFLSSGNLNALKTAASSIHADLYSRSALELLREIPAFRDLQPNYEILRTIKTTHNSPALWNVKDPFAWEAIRDSYRNTNDAKKKKQILELLDYSNTQAHLSILQPKMAKQQHYLTPYRDVFSNFDTQTQIMLYSLARQESLFIPSAVSTSYALGVMQIMPFNVESVAKQLKQPNRTLFDMFDVSINVPYSEVLVKPLKKEFKHPLFIAYGYNGGGGFLRRTLGNGELFKKSRSFSVEDFRAKANALTQKVGSENLLKHSINIQQNKLDPWYSMEIIPYEESRYYGKRVILNYVIYSETFREKSNLLPLLFQTLVY